MCQVVWRKMCAVQCQPICQSGAIRAEKMLKKVKVEQTTFTARASCQSRYLKSQKQK
jgi:hypothetical protein